MSEPQLKIRVIFKSGRMQDFVCDSFEISRSNELDVVTKFTWKNISPQINFIALRDISAILELHEEI